MQYTKSDSRAVLATLELLKKRLQERYEEAADRQTLGGRPSGHMLGLTEAIEEVDNLLKENTPQQPHLPPMRLSVMESQLNLGSGVTFQSWFTRAGSDNIRSELYLFEDGSVVAYQDCINGVQQPLYMESMFKTLHEGELAFATILNYAGGVDPDAVEMFYMGR